MSKGRLIVLSGFAGSGKGTLVNHLLKTYENYTVSVSATTRTPRPGEEEGINYFFKTVEEFEQMIGEGLLLEYASYVENYYGTPAAYVDKQLVEGRNVILEIEIQGALKVKEKRPDTLLIFVTPPSIEELERRLRGRGTESEEVIRSRMRRAAEESAFMARYDYIVVNDVVEQCAERMHAIVTAEQQKSSSQTQLIDRIQNELRSREETL